MRRRPIRVLKRIALDETRLGATSRALATALFAAFPAARDSAHMVDGAEADGYSPEIALDSPTCDPGRRLGVWLDESGIPSVDFGTWHTHGDVLSGDSSLPRRVRAVSDIVAAILADQLVLIVDVGGEYSGHTSVLDLREPDALEDELTSRYSPGCLRIQSWSGRLDREVGLSDLEAPGSKPSKPGRS